MGGEWMEKTKDGHGGGWAYTQYRLRINNINSSCVKECEEVCVCLKNHGNKEIVLK